MNCILSTPITRISCETIVRGKEAIKYTLLVCIQRPVTDKIIWKGEDRIIITANGNSEPLSSTGFPARLTTAISGGSGPLICGLGCGAAFAFAREG
ncbi:hypothetical protein AYX14_07113 [Cryptococcus neoformans]|nr:hypothetical protein AYX14_07113 [Cryptococcus neoformans var. grubii]